MMNIKHKLAAVLLGLGLGFGLGSSPAMAGRGGSAAQIQSAVSSGSVDAIIAEIERAEALMCADCVQIVTNLTEHPRYEVRKVAAWWFAKRPGLQKMLATEFVSELSSTNSIKVRNAADFLGATKTYTALPALRAAIGQNVSPEAKLAMVRAIKYMAHPGGKQVLTTAMGDADPSVRAAAVTAWRDIRDQADGGPAVALLGDADANVRAQAAAVVGALTTQAGRAALESIVVNDPDPVARRNAAWALGKLGQAASRTALTRATGDSSGLVRMTARASLSALR
ncbi:MAG: HEAT repeat domain-containing protein [Kofleriaceae bacterium]